ncbi:MAG TPA: hypothetical protein VMT81_01065 [Candidatus Paceibacterota bacterium]|nr:hypothetical protein [Candidatus Paceibacterota bacterium]
MEENRKTFFEELRSLSEPAKRKILVASTVVIMFAVIYIWLGYFNNLVSISPPTSPATADADAGRNSAGSWWQAIGSGIAGAVKELRGPGQYNVKPQ